jgi:hypothetical protein
MISIAQVLKAASVMLSTVASIHAFEKDRSEFLQYAQELDSMAAKVEKRTKNWSINDSWFSKIVEEVS